MADQNKMQLLDLNHEVIVLIISKTTLLHQFTHRRVSKNFKKIIEDYVWLDCKRLSENDFPGTYYLPVDQICQVMFPKMPHLKKLYLPQTRIPEKKERIIDLASRYCHEISYLDSQLAKMRYVMNLKAQSVPFDHLKFKFFAGTLEELNKLRDLPKSIPIEISLFGIGDIINLSFHTWLDENRICGVVGRDFTVQIPPKVTSLGTDILDDEVMKFRHQLESIIISQDRLDNLKYFDHLSNVRIYTENDNEDFRKVFCDNLESFLLGNGRTVTHLELGLPYRYDILLLRLASMNRDIKWRYLDIETGLEGNMIKFEFNCLSILFDGALNWNSETLNLASNCHRLKVISIFDEFIYHTKIVRRIRKYKKFRAKLEDDKLQSWKSMIMTYASDKKNSKIHLKLYVDNPDEDKIISGDNWIISQHESCEAGYDPIYEGIFNSKYKSPTIRANDFLKELFGPH